ncbi:uracil-DNA glycosylase [Luteibaculum oceani]|uniref:Uracil-DNA glycosylase n=1 Tax=Luteibaculum oceani TaxID=1294296 RepID=A0A5C6UZY0_9FLAO|nr:uracil-DNA glycosylase [Luteibaculum oceani]TXC76215.1 uracil-DNA glycosylase [Luteibaculum oceani]
MELKINPVWKDILASEFSQDYFKELMVFLNEECKENTIYPPKELIFNAFNHCDPHEIKVVILGQDPYHGPNQANGLAFSVNPGVKIPPSLRNIFKELQLEYRFDIPKSGDLSFWADQGVLLLNTTLTVRAGEAASHQNKGWELFTDRVIKHLAGTFENLVYLLWGSHAHKKESHIPESKNLILKAVHPSPLSASRGFFGCNHFIECNEYLLKVGKTPIQWGSTTPTLFD